MILKEALKDAVNSMCTFVQLILSALLFFEDSPAFWALLIDVLILYGILKSPVALFITNIITFMLLLLILLFLACLITTLLDRLRNCVRNQNLWEVWK